MKAVFHVRRLQISLGVLATILSGTGSMAEPITPVPDKIACVIADRQDSQSPDRVQLTGWLGARISANANNRLKRIDTSRLLEGYQRRPGRQTWDGEHVGKWLHAATLAWVDTGDLALRAKLDQTAMKLCACQLDDGYLGTYLPRDRWQEWDVWAHKYNLLGLITYMRYTGNLAPLPTCRRMADLLCREFGPAPDQRDIIASGQHVGMASTSVLEPMVLLYRLTGEQRYLDFCEYLVIAWEQPNGPQLISRLLEHKGVNEVGNAKAYEMLSCLNGALELCRTTGEPKLLTAALNAWQDIVDHRLYLTGAASYCELFREKFDFPNNNNVGETCVTVTWLQFNAQLLRLTGEARFAEQLEHVTLNQLLGAQQPDGSAWGYYVQLEGKKPYSGTLDGHCCLSSGPRGVALLPTFAMTTDEEGVVVNLFDSGTAELTLRDGSPVKVTIDTLYPADGRVQITLDPASPQEFALKVRVPKWSRESLTTSSGATSGSDGYTTWRRQWKAGDKVELNLKLEPRLVVGDHLNQGQAAILYGPLVLAADEALLEGAVPSLQNIALPKADLAAIDITPEAAPTSEQTWSGAQRFKVQAIDRRAQAPLTTRLLPFADAGMTGTRYKVWLPLGDQPSGNLLQNGLPSQSRPGNVEGSIIDGDLQSLVVTFDGQLAAEDWFAVKVDQPVTARRVIFTHGRNYHDGGWFDTSQGKPRVQVQRIAGADWQIIGELSDYPETTTTSGESGRLTWENRSFTLLLAKPVTFVAVRIIGVPASGDNPQQAFSSCAELQALTE